MVFKEQFVAVVKCQGKILREHGDLVTLPFGSEYSILLKNLESRKASVKIHVDGQDVLGGNSLVINPNSEMELERFIDSLDRGNRFKFIQKTQEIQEHRGDKVDDGIIRVEFTYEKQKPEKKVILHDHQHSHYHCPVCGHHTCRCSYQTYTSWYAPAGYSNYSVSNSSSAKFGSDVITRNMCDTGGSGKKMKSRSVEKICSKPSNVVMDSLSQDACFINEVVDTPLADEGITVKGSESQQQFHYADIGLLEMNSNVITIRLKGTQSNGVTKVKKPITTKTKIQCSSCGRKSKSHVKFCGNCGTALV